MSITPQKILLIQLGDIGDVILSFPSVRALKETFPSSEIIVAVRQKAAELIGLCPWASGSIIIKTEHTDPLTRLKNLAGFAGEVKSHRFDMAIDLRTGTRGAVLAFLSGAKTRVAYTASHEVFWRDRLFNWLITPTAKKGTHILDYNLQLLDAIGVRTSHPEPQLIVPDSLLQNIQAIKKEHDIPLEAEIITIQPFSLWSYKEWAADKFVSLIKKLRDKYGFYFIIAGGPGEKDKADILVKNCGENVYNFAGKTSIDLYAALLHSCRMLIGVDSAGQHLAAAAGTPTLTIYGPSFPGTWAPRGPDNFVVQKDLGCGPCYQTGCNNSMQSRCIDELEVEEVLDAIENLLSHLTKNAG